MKISRNFVLVALLLPCVFLFSACSIAPLLSPHTARSIQSNKSEIIAGTSSKLKRPFLKFGKALSENLDIGLLSEFQLGLLLGVWAKYSFLNQKEGLSIALDGSVGGSGRATYISAGPVLSYRHGIWEGGLSTKYNHVNWGEQDVSLGDIGKIKVGDSDFNYIYTTMSNSLWLSADYALLLQISNIKGVGNIKEEGSFGDNLIYGIGLIMMM